MILRKSTTLRKEKEMDLKGMDFSNLSPELKAKAEKCKSMDELLDLAKSEGVELTDEQLAYASGGNNSYTESTDDCSSYRNCFTE